MLYEIEREDAKRGRIYGWAFVCNRLSYFTDDSTQKVIAFLNPWHWDPTLLFVMLGAVGVHFDRLSLVRRRPSLFSIARGMYPLEETLRHDC